MPRKEKIICQCGGELTRPIPVHCPHCGAVIAGVRHAWWSLVWPVLVLLLMFGALIGFLVWLISGTT